MIPKLKHNYSTNLPESKNQSFLRLYSKYLNIILVVILILFLFFSYRCICLTSQLSEKKEDLLNIKFKLKEIEANNNNLNQDKSILNKKRNNIKEDIRTAQNFITSETKNIEELMLANETKFKILNDLQTKLSLQNQLNMNFTQIVVENEEFYKLKREVYDLRNKRDEIRKELNQSHLNIDSRIITNQEEIDQLKQWLNYSGRILFNLMYRLSTYGRSYENFHTICDKYYHTMSLIKLESGTIVGGFLSVNMSGEGFKKDPYAFLYNLSKRKKYPVQFDSAAYFIDQFNFLEYGDGDLKVLYDKVTSTFPMSYGSKDSQEHELTDGKKVQKLIDFEIFHLYYYDD